MKRAKPNPPEQCVLTAPVWDRFETAQRKAPVSTPSSLQGQYRAGGHVSTRPAGFSYLWFHHQLHPQGSSTDYTFLITVLVMDP